MIFAASIASQAAAALAQSMQSRKPNGSDSSTQGQSGGFSADIDALMSNAQNTLGGMVSGAGALMGSVQSVGQDMLGLGTTQPAAQTPAAGVAQAYAATHALAD